MVRAWFQSLKQPDNGISCCGDADAYWADETHVEANNVIAVITDERDDGPLGRRHIPIGTRFVVPPNKMNRDTNPSGHIIIFIGAGDQVFCYISTGGV